VDDDGGGDAVGVEGAGGVGLAVGVEDDGEGGGVEELGDARVAECVAFVGLAGAAPVGGDDGDEWFTGGLLGGLLEGDA